MRTQYSFMLFVVVLVVVACSPLQSRAGWLMKDRDGSTTLLNDGVIKYVEEEDSGSFLLIDYNRGTITMVEPSQKAYATGSIDEYCAIMDKLLGAFEEMEEALPGEDAKQPEVKIVAAGSERIGGFDTDKYQVMVDGELYEERWITTDKRIMEELGDTAKHEQFMNCLEGAGDDIENTPAYKALNTKGLDLRSISYDFGDKEYNIDTVSIEQKDTAEEALAPPSSFEKMSFEEFYLSSAQ